MGLDIRLPLGLMMGITGLILVVYGAVTNGGAIYATSDGININLIWGSLMLLVGIVMTWLGYRR